ncbi:long-subunit acyl-CoA synthetase (AMP-forming) [Herbihabitans rhizosphaerae]|uniref:Acyl-CoA synthetase n=1 Tax=Herbihabitans rhizosphaerae TaxID=1872711 RepID=A0A4Q7KH57_9PSEU|nr:AMP-binding protein [Herbihabitans rhizosphaerae]RZS32178.1 long-subunit acyl-CoA synthetase (AMP-forming) [Herbihabitans rhizosphaerae]
MSSETTESTCTHPSGKTVHTLCEAFQESAVMRPDAVALRTAGGGLEITWRSYAERVRAIAAGLAARGVRRGDTVGLMLTNRPEFNLVDTAALHLGAIPFSIYNTSSAEQIAYLFSNAENKIVVTEQQFLPRLGGVDLEHVVSVDGEADGATETLAGLEAAGDDGFDFDAAWRAVEPSAVATLIYTSGTTGPPKGVELTHSNLLAEADALCGYIDAGPDDRTTSYLPSAHVADRAATHYFNMIYGVQITTVDDPRAIAAALPEVRPTVWVGVPRVWQKIKAGIEAKIAAEPKQAKRKIAEWAIGVGRKAALARLSTSDLPLPLKVQHRLAETLVLGKLRHALGLDELRWAVSGAAAIPVDTLEFFLGIGIPVYEVWGMSETTAAVTTNSPEDLRIGSVGKVAPGSELKLAEDGELLVRGPLIMRGYRKQPDRTAETIDSDGWLHSGDIAKIDDDGFVFIVDRKKELIINESGKNMSPSNIENALKGASPLVGQAVAIGDGRPYVTALIVLDPDMAAAKSGLADAAPVALAEHEGLRAAVTEAVRTGNASLSRVEQVKRFRIVASAWEPGGEELTPTMKLKRRPIADKYRSEIDGLYAPSPDPDVINI